MNTTNKLILAAMLAFELGRVTTSAHAEAVQVDHQQFERLISAVDGVGRRIAEAVREAGRR